MHKPTLKPLKKPPKIPKTHESPCGGPTLINPTQKPHKTPYNQS